MALSKTKRPFASDIFQYVLEVLLPLEAFREYIKITKEIVEREIKQKIEEYEKASDEEIEWMFDEVTQEIRHNMLQLFYNSLLVTLYSFLERKMRQLCQLALEVTSAILQFVAEMLA
ncbi:MAG: hypothetical protein KJ893_06350 [Candidatus Omnitrophica bacterium]|nr:hypothetical protein [Candidatus Omnitrophota bacterium]MCG2693249.1 hypothetical protein [Candidatus Parcubacteria bacterium]